VALVVSSEPEPHATSAVANSPVARNVALISVAEEWTRFARWLVDGGA